jgi:NADH-quinone oxidoreductase subunit H
MTEPFLAVAIKLVAVFALYLSLAAVMSLAERKVLADMQDRLGPMRTGPFGVLQPIADGLKLIFKEDYTPRNVDRVVYFAAPLAACVPAFTAAAVLPFGYPTVTIGGREISMQITELNVGLLFVLAMSSLVVYGIVLAGWSSNNKYSLLGGVRSSAQLISYELSLGLSLLGVFMIVGSPRASDIVNYQLQPLSESVPWLPAWGIFVQPIAFLLFLIAMIAETNRVPFDLPEAESELVAGYFTEYTSMKLSLFFMAEYAGMMTLSLIAVGVFLGGPSGFVFLPPGLEWICGIFWYMVKAAAFMFFFIHLRATLPRLRYDQLMRVGWYGLLPAVLGNVLLTGLILAWKGQ